MHKQFYMLASDMNVIVFFFFGLEKNLDETLFV